MRGQGIDGLKHLNRRFRFVILLAKGVVHQMARNVASVLWGMLLNAGVKRCYGIVGDALNPVMDALRQNADIDFANTEQQDAAHGHKLSAAKQVLTRRIDALIKTMEHHVKLV
jgi:hypothetical protein